jgi:hypothetical protein
MDSSGLSEVEDFAKVERRRRRLSGLSKPEGFAMFDESID